MPRPPKAPDFDTMRRALERARPGYGVRLAQEATEWPLRGFRTMDVLRARVLSDWYALPAHERDGGCDET